MTLSSSARVNITQPGFRSSVVRSFHLLAGIRGGSRVFCTCSVVRFFRTEKMALQYYFPTGPRGFPVSGNRFCKVRFKADD